jgi:hypothetical protein
VTSGERSTADEITCRQRRGSRLSENGSGQLSQAKGGTSQRIFPRSFFDKLNYLRLDLQRLADNQAAMQAERRDEIDGLELPVRERAIDNLETYRQPLDVVGYRRRVQPCARNRVSQFEDDLRLDFRSAVRRKSKLRAGSIRIVHRVVVHVGPNQRLELQGSPHSLVRIADLQASNFAASRHPQPGELGLHRVRANWGSWAEGGVAIAAPLS